MNNKNWADLREIFDIELPCMQLIESKLLLQKSTVKEELHPLIIRMLLDLDSRLRKLEEEVRF